MIFNKHSNLIGQHAFLGASNYHWLNYTPEKLQSVYESSKAAEMGTKLHEFAKTCIELGQKLPDIPKTLNMYVNDAIGYGMIPEQVLCYSEFCFGTCDTIYYDGRVLRIHDLKTGVTPVHMEQLRIYAALFCLEYHVDPAEIDIFLRIYQNDDNIDEQADPNVIREIMQKAKINDKILYQMKYGTERYHNEEE